MPRRKLELTPKEAQPTPTPPPEAGKESVPVPEQIQNRVAEFQERAEAERPRRRYSPRKPKQPAEPSPEETAKRERVQGLRRNYAVLGGIVVDIACKRLPNPMPATDEEKELFGNALGAVIEKHSEELDAWGEEFALLFAAGVIFVPRFIVPKREPEPLPPPFQGIIPPDVGKTE